MGVTRQRKKSGTSSSARLRWDPLCALPFPALSLIQHLQCRILLNCAAITEMHHWKVEDALASSSISFIFGPRTQAFTIRERRVEGGGSYEPTGLEAQMN